MLSRLVVILALGLAPAAFAGGLEVSPVLVELGKPSLSSVINVKNDGDELKRYQLEMMSWGEAPSGQMELSPTKDVVFFPQLLTLKPGESRNVRVGVTQPAGAKERTYRLFVTELPGLKPPGSERQVQVLTRVGIPIFIVPAQAANRVELTPLSVKKGNATFGLANSGNAHARPAKVVFTAADGQGNAVFQKSWDGWYLLAGGERDYTVQIPAADCKRATSFRVEVLGEKLSLSKTLQAAPGVCGS